MPSPFPGMDPYLEGPSWMSFHGQFIAEIARQLSPRLRPKYVALMDERVVWDSAENDVWIDMVEGKPDVAVIKARGSGAGAATATLSAPLTMQTVMPVPVTHRSVEIRDVANRQLVCAIETLSPTNKRGAGYRKYLTKRGRLLGSTAHLVEIDLLRQGKRVPMIEPLPAGPYFAFVSRAGHRPAVGVWPISLRQPLPKIPVPLLAGDEDVPLDLQQALTAVYDVIGYDTILNYSARPSVALPDEDTQWAAEVVRAAK